MTLREVKLPSGAVLKIHHADFDTAKELYQTVLEEAKHIVISSKTEMAVFYKDLFCVGFSSKKIEACLWKCFPFCTYDSGKGALKIDKDTFQPIEARDDYLTVCMEVAKDNIHPFVKSLYAEYGHIIKTILTTPV